MSHVPYMMPISKRFWFLMKNQCLYTWNDDDTPQTPQLLKWDDDSEEIGLAVSAANNCAQACWSLGSSFVISKLLTRLDCDNINGNTQYSLLI